MIARPIALAFVVAAGFAAGGAFYASTVQKGVRLEQVRVEKQGKKVNAQVEKRQRAAAATPANRVLDKWSTD